MARKDYQQKPMLSWLQLIAVTSYWWGICGVGIVMVSAVGCKRAFYRRTADRDAYCLINEKGEGPTWGVSEQFNIEPDQRSRFYDPTCPTDPSLPFPAPQLYNYPLPNLATSTPQPRKLDSTDGSDGESSQGPAKSPTAEESAQDPAALPAKIPAELPLNTIPENAPTSSAPQGATSAAKLQLRSLPLPPSAAIVRTASASQRVSAADQPLIIPAAPLDPSKLDSPQKSSDGNEETKADKDKDAGPPRIDEPLGQSPLPELGAVPRTAWGALPESCVRRMLEFETVRYEYQRTFEQEVTAAQLDPAQRVNLENILEIALINSREYQTRRETLYRVALRLSLQRFDYDLKFLSRGNGTLLNYTHDRNAGIEVNRLGAPTNLGITRSLYTGGDLVARFANDVVLTFNGPSGYSTSVGSELFIDLFQPIMQRDVRFEPLTQAERDVVYAARDFVRFQKVLFRDLARQYYSLLLTYRSIAINTQDYFSNLREFNRAEATQQAGRMPLVQVDQFEQNAIRSRGNVINSCNALEGALDQLKFRIGLPVELPLNVALSELEELTLRDEASVLREQLARKTRVFQQGQASEGTPAAIPALTEVARRLLSLAEVNSRIEPGAATTESDNQIPDLRILVALLEAQEKRIEASDDVELLNNAQAGDDEELIAKLFLRYKEAVLLTLEAARREILLVNLVLSQQQQADANNSSTLDQDSKSKSRRRVEDLSQRWQAEVQAFNALDEKLGKIPYAERIEILPEINIAAGQSLVAARKLERDILDVLGEHDVTLPQSAAELDELVASVLELRRQTPDAIGLAELEVDVDEAMLTALVQRLDLMNRRGQLADAWRQIKYAGDDLKSILNLRATQSIRTRTGSNNPVDFSFDDSTTRLSMDFDTPLNRRSERNIFRLALVNYNVALRNLIEAQDNVKLDIRNELRAIALDRNQYEIAIASAALAYDRVTSTRMQVAMAQGNITARDFLEAQQAYTQSLSSVAQQHIGYIQDRIQFFLDLEQLQIDTVNYWPELRNESYPFLPNTNFGSTTPDGYGCLPDGPWYSDCMRRMEQVPSGVSTIQTPASSSTPR